MKEGKAGGGVKKAEEEDGETTFSPTNSSKEQLNMNKVHKTTSDR